MYWTAVISATIGALVVYWRDNTYTGFSVPAFIVAALVFDRIAVISLTSTQKSLDEYFQSVTARHKHLNLSFFRKYIFVENRGTTVSVMSKVSLLILGIGYFLLALYDAL